MSVVLEGAAGPVLLSAARTGPVPLFLKQLPRETVLAYLSVGPGHPGAWITGAPHVVFARPVPPRLAGNALIWLAGAVTYRLEGRTLGKAEALALAREVTP